MEGVLHLLTVLLYVSCTACLLLAVSSLNKPLANRVHCLLNVLLTTLTRVSLFCVDILLFDVYLFPDPIVCLFLDVIIDLRNVCIVIHGCGIALLLCNLERIWSIFKFYLRKQNNLDAATRGSSEW
eukprot:298542_1